MEPAQLLIALSTSQSRHNEKRQSGQRHKRRPNRFEEERENSSVPLRYRQLRLSLPAERRSLSHGDTNSRPRSDADSEWQEFSMASSANARSARVSQSVCSGGVRTRRTLRKSKVWASSFLGTSRHLLLAGFLLRQTHNVLCGLDWALLPTVKRLLQRLL
jgi:hypothetical protein